MLAVVLPLRDSLQGWGFFLLFRSLALLPVSAHSVGAVFMLFPLGSVSSPLCVCETWKRYVVKHNLITEVYLMTVMETTTCFDLYWPSSGCLRGT